jgi:hypothetical protein
VAEFMSSWRRTSRDFLNNVTLRRPKGRRNREYKVNLNDRNHIMPTRQYVSWAGEFELALRLSGRISILKSIQYADC